MFEIEKGIPVQNNLYDKYHFGDMEIGDSFAFPSELFVQVSSAAFRFGKRHNKKFSTRKVQNGYRLWRIK